MSKPGRFGHAVTFAAGKGEISAPHNIDQMSGGNVEGLYPCPAPKDRSDNFSLYKKRGTIPFRKTRLLMLSAKSALCAPHRRNIQPETEVTREAESSGVGNPLTVDEDGVWNRIQTTKSVEENREFTKGK